MALRLAEFEVPIECILTVFQPLGSGGELSSRLFSLTIGNCHGWTRTYAIALQLLRSSVEGCVRGAALSVGSLETAEVGTDR